MKKCLIGLRLQITQKKGSTKLGKKYPPSFVGPQLRVPELVNQMY